MNVRDTIIALLEFDMDTEVTLSNLNNELGTSDAIEDIVVSEDGDQITIRYYGETPEDTV